MADFRNKRRKKICQMCAGKDVNYKDTEIIKKYIGAENKKILPRRATGNCAKHQRIIAGEVKKARFMGLIPYVK